MCVCLSPGSTLSTLSRHSLDTVDTVDTGVNRHHLDTTSTPPTLVSTSVDIRDALMLSRCQRCQGGGWAHGQSKLIGVQSVPTAQGMSPYHNTSPQYTLEPQRRGLSTFPAWLTLLTPVDNIRASRMSTLVDTSVGGVEVVSRWCRLTPVSTAARARRPRPPPAGRRYQDAL